MGRETSAEFKKAFEDVKKLAAEPTQNEKLDLYAYAKIAQGEDVEAKRKSLGMFDIKGKTMTNHWQKKLDEGVTPEQADKAYIELVAQLQKTYGTK
ncbi:Acyl-CoA-binding protein ACBP [Lasiodiplodia theobromae]|uniref:Acyl-CoA-binding protein n=1 Tax=Lasiodiplodia theobromae TaxID=45133 RepID=A0A5N5DS69_9PEZI|nr:Acyl binding protein [Lasiodiplodia theobromae]KAB2580490.1 Acyl-CoA-binding protein [Lasiodiplodia theobromae]KAF4541062.1 Acyl binding protein [Lasiodiplodia theobromae]KAF9632402.1 Acyl-CoA-binding protein ACBP [Lasiodiplodia theobromae]